MNIVAATGHRPEKLLGYSCQAAAKLQVFARARLIELDPDVVVVGMALGWDMAVGYAASELGIPFTAAIPFKGQELRWPMESQVAYGALLALAAHVRIVSPGGYSADKMHTRNEWMAHNCNKMLALWDGSHGGTHNCVRYAESIGKPVVNVWKQFRDAYPTTY